MERLECPSKELKNLSERLTEETRQLIEMSVLGMIGKNELTVAQWRHFGLQRTLIANGFVELLKAGIQSAELLDDDRLAAVLRMNLYDELGLDLSGNEKEAGSHEQWRQEYCLALGVDLPAGNRRLFK